MKIRFPQRLKKGGVTKGWKELYLDSLEKFIEDLMKVQEGLDFHMGSRDWCYFLEPHGLKKNDFGWMQGCINDARTEGFIQPGFILEEEGHKVEEFEDGETNPEQAVEYEYECWKEAKQTFERCWQWQNSVSFWKDKKYYLQLLVEKVGLKSLFRDICEQYKIPIANMRGHGSYEQKAVMAKNFRQAEARGQIPVLLVCSDFDPSGLDIGKQKEWFIKNHKFTGWEPDNLEVDRFGLSYTFIQDNNLTWIDGLTTISGKDLADPEHKFHNRKSIQYYLRKYCMVNGKIKPRKCEANAIVVVPELGRQLLVDTIEKWLGKGTYDKYRNEKEKKIKEVQKLIEEKLKGEK